MKPISTQKIRIRNRKKYNSVPRKQRKTGYKVANPTNFWDTVATRGTVILSRIKKSRGLCKDTKKEYYIDKI